MFFEKFTRIALPPATFPELVVDKKKCTGCGRCVRTCPVQLLMIEDKICKSNERYDQFRCLVCQNCAAVCPEKALEIKGDYRVPKGYWKNNHLFSGGKIYPTPFEDSAEKSYDTFKDRLSETERIIYQRRSNRLYKKKQVEPELLRRVLEAARFAPSAGNNQPWKFIVIQNKSLLEEINLKTKEKLKFYMKIGLPHEWLDKKIPGDKTAKLKTWQKIVLNLFLPGKKGDVDQRARGGVNAVTSDPDYHVSFHAPTLILLLSDKRAIGGTELDMGICGQTMVLAAHALGLGTCYIDLITTTLELDKKLRKKIGIQDPFVVATTLAIGYPQGKIDGIVKREKLRVEWIK